ncbi:hypothetical protein ABID82_005091 [Methylobacterium sp. PvP062]|uniref:LPXTG cell wall anchor domain-containing protein n=1 Tax=Methylobacterium radiotolerans TaxID=31998 RepID=A0ABV2NU47_9HYPH|nr:hypothetical protein [Methylobacterium sp. PvP105]MBP2505584.1 hypothetical protein [Methylobacterium sp. PvP109]
MVVGVALLVLGPLFWIRSRIKKPRPALPAPRHRPF